MCKRKKRRKKRVLFFSFIRHAFTSLVRFVCDFERDFLYSLVRSDENLSIYLFYFIRVNMWIAVTGSGFYFHWWYYFFLLLRSRLIHQYDAHMRTQRWIFYFIFFLRYLAIWIQSNFFFIRLSHQHISHSIVLSASSSSSASTTLFLSHKQPPAITAKATLERMLNEYILCVCLSLLWCQWLVFSFQLFLRILFLPLFCCARFFYCT